MTESFQPSSSSFSRPPADEQIFLLLDRYVASECTPAEAGIVRRWASESPERAELVDVLCRVYAAGGSFDSTTTESAVRTLEARLSLFEAGVGASVSQRIVDRANRNGWLRRALIPMAGALSIALVVLGVRAGYLSWTGAGNSSTGAPVHISTAPGQRATASLPDGSTVMLAPGSHLRYASNFGIRTNRAIELDGAAMFTVPHSDGVPFVVTSGGVPTRVLGTSFVVRHYTTDADVRVAVTDGKVTTGASRHAVTLVAGRVALMTDSMTTTSLMSGSSSNDPTTAWTSGRLVFKEAPVSEVLAEVGRWYGYTFRLTDSAIVQRHVTTVLTTNESVRTLRLLKDLLSVDMQYDGDVITLRPRKRAKSVMPTERTKAVPFTYSEVGK